MGFQWPAWKRALMRSLRRQFIEQILIALDIGAAGSANLDEREAALVGRVEFEKSSMARKRSRMPFRVVDAVNADPEKCGADAKLVA